MDKQSPVLTPLGRLYDPLLQLAGRVHRVLAHNLKTVWADSNGYVFAAPPDHLATIKPHTIVGVYAKRSSLPAIEMGLRLALRERASKWITDWKTQPQGTRCTDSRALRLAISRKRRRSHTHGAVVVAPRNARRSNHPPLQS